jgi:hypothetical protein
MFWYILVSCEMFINILGWHRVPSRSSPETMEMFHCHGTTMCKAWQGSLLGPKIWTLEQALGARWNQQLPKRIAGILSNTLSHLRIISISSYHGVIVLKFCLPVTLHFTILLVKHCNVHIDWVGSAGKQPWDDPASDRVFGGKLLRRIVHG